MNIELCTYYAKLLFYYANPMLLLENSNYGAYYAMYRLSLSIIGHHRLCVVDAVNDCKN